MTASLCADGLRVAYGDRVGLDRVDLDLPPGGLLAVTGPSGGGKTTLLWALAAAQSPTAGRVLLGEVELVDRDQAAGLGVVLCPQGNGLALALTAAENVLVPLLATGVPPAEARQRTAAALGLVGLEESHHHLVEELSGGQQQRVAVARALAGRPRVLLADEPTSDLDAANRERVLALLRAEADRGACVVLATNDPEAAARADAELALDAGVATWLRR